MLTVEYLKPHGLYLVIPVLPYQRHEHPDQEFMFSEESEARRFIDYYFRNPVAAIFAYDITERNRL